MPEDAGILGETPPANAEMHEVRAVLDEIIVQHSLPPEVPSDIALGFMPHQGENRATRRKASATFTHPEFSRREGLLQRRARQRGKLDPELRRLQHERLKQK